MRFPSLHKLHAQKYKTSLPHRFMQCSGKPGRWVIFHIPFCTVSARGATRALAADHRPGSISIHAPARGATALPSWAALFTSDFNSRPCERGDYMPHLLGAGPGRFQFTPLREGRRALSVGGSGLLRYFNSRPCERGDPPPRWDKSHISISIHAPARGATAAHG